MEASEPSWQTVIDTLESNRALVAAWPATEPNPNAPRCEFSRHRTLAHLRAAQQTWLEAALLFAEKDNVSIVRPHPWRLFTENHYELIPWGDHLQAFLTHRDAWIELVRRPGHDFSRGGNLSRKPRTIESLTRLVVEHELHHIQSLRPTKRP